ncbi:flagellar basal body P-ring protein FlgI [Fodinibius halophilus]|uniref:Flagellar P-ring protein n=1 Tax=Fodinibius halophilus TaxID=1736908 RepID=A0A6M1T3Z2_9BACT|nr:flagellar basal body P-ring protein FlgI [Fodinibius halophilus]NGP87373.1 flagellar basal body P-ring protein FlgI [Fodinibius halophilus]
MRFYKQKEYCIQFLVPTMLLTLMVTVGIQAQGRLNSHVKVQHAQGKKIVGYGLVAGLDRTGDRTISSRGSQFTVQSIANMLENFGINVDPSRLRTRNVAAVMVTADMGPYHARGSEIDVTVSSLGDASSLKGGVLLETPLLVPGTKKVYAKAQGALVVGGVKSELGASRISRNGSLTARVPGGGIVEDNEVFELNANEPLGLVLEKPGYINARRITEAINTNFDEEIASVFNPGLIKVEWPDAFQEQGMKNIFISTIMEQKVELHKPARVVVNERTGTVVAGGNVTINNAMVSHGSVQVRTQVNPLISQPPALSGGETKVVPVPQVGISEESAQNVVLDPDTNVQQLAEALNSLGLNPRDIISIFQALDRAGALQGELIVM